MDGDIIFYHFACSGIFIKYITILRFSLFLPLSVLRGLISNVLNKLTTTKLLSCSIMHFKNNSTNCVFSHETYYMVSRHVNYKFMIISLILHFCYHD